MEGMSSLSSSMSLIFFFKQKTAYEMRISDWSSDFCSSDLAYIGGVGFRAGYGDKLRRTIGAADPGAVPGGSTRWLSCSRGQLTGPNQDRRVLKRAVFARNGPTATAHNTSANDNEAQLGRAHV